MSTPRITFKHVTIDTDNPEHPHCKTAGDIDGDGNPDVLAASAAGGGAYWYRYPDWTKHKIADGTFTTDMKVADLDGDGHNEVILPMKNSLLYYKNPMSSGGDPTIEPWEPVQIGPIGAHDIRVCDFNNDGVLDIITRQQSGFGHNDGNAIRLWKQITPTEWELKSFECPHGEGLQVADIDRDGFLDVIIGGRWYRNPGHDHGEWTKHLYMSESHFEENWTNNDVVVEVGDLNHDGRPEIVLSPSEGSGILAWYEAPIDPTQSNWVEHIIEPEIDHVHGMALGDIDNDGQLDIVTAKMLQATPPQAVTIYYNQNHGQSWEKQMVAETGSHNICLTDIGQTGRLSIFGCNWHNRAVTGGAIELWINEG